MIKQNNLTDKFKVLIKNYNTSSSNFELGRQELQTISIEGLKNLIIKTNKISREDKKYIKIIIDELIITPKINQEFEFSYNISGTSKNFTTTIKSLENVINYAQNNKKKVLRKERKESLFLLIILASIPISNIIFIMIMLFHIPLIFIKILLIVLLFLSIIIIISLLSDLIPDILLKVNPKYKIEYSFPFIDEIEPEDYTIYLLLTGQYAYYIFFLLLTHLGFLSSFNNLDSLNIALWIFFFISTVFLSILIAYEISDYKASKKKKRKFLKFVINKFYAFDVDKIELKIYYFQLANVIRNTPSFKIKQLSKITSLITYLISVLPFFL